VCGIAGIWHLDGQPVDRQVLSKMTHTIAHRGPDGEGIWIRNNIGFGHRRLAIRDLSELGHQPMSCPTGRVTVTFNGEIYNYDELRSELERDYCAVFRSRCDTEILPLGYLSWGDELFSKLEGMFAIGLWDSMFNRLVLARDAVGIKPLFYSRMGDTIRFASEIKAIIADPCFPRKLDSAGLHRLFASGYVGPDATTVMGIRQLEPGTILSINHKGEESLHRFWHPTRRPTIRRMDEALEIFVPLMQSVIKDQLVSDIDIGILQSGGVDSTILSLIANQSAPVPLYTAKFSNRAHDESGVAARFAQNAGLEHQIINVSTDLDPEKTFRRVVYHYDGQAADEAAGPLLLLTEALAKNTHVALSGDGGDEFFGGYPTYRATRIASKLSGILPTGLASVLGTFLYGHDNNASTRMSIVAKLSRFLQGVAYGNQYAHTEWRRFLPHFMASSIYGPGLLDMIPISPMSAYRRAFDYYPHANVLDRAMIADQCVHLPGGLLYKTDCMSMANSIEIRVPFLDKRIMEFAASCDLELLLPRKGPSKPLLRHTAKKLGSNAEIFRGKKRGFNNPISSLLRGPLRQLGNHLIVKNSDLMEPYLQPQGVQLLWSEHQDSTRDHAYALWPILHFLLWRESTGMS
jgi:asparagine synthase (glutamine-hydrolysing)